MTVELMRKIDYFVGIPVCFILSIKRRVEKFFLIKRKKKIKKILLIGISEMGSIVLAYTAIKYLKERYNPEFYFFTFKENINAVKLLTLIPEKNFITLRKDNLFVFIRDFINAIIHLKKLKIDAVIDMELFSRVSAIISYISGARIRVGFHNFYNEGLYRGNLQTHNVMYNPYKHISINFLALARALEKSETPLLKENLKITPQLPPFKISPEAYKRIVEKIINKNKNFSKKSLKIILNPNASKMLPIRRWPIENYIALGKKLLKKFKNAYIIITGAKDEIADGRLLEEGINNKRCINLAGETEFDELMALYKLCDILITNDSGPAHFASLTPIKIFVFFGPETPVLYAPLKNATIFYSNLHCSPCVSAFNHRKTPCKEPLCLKSITVEQVFNEVLKYVRKHLWKKI